MEIHRNLLICPACNNDKLNELDDILKCINCGREYIIRNNIPLMFLPNDWDKSKYDVSEIVNAIPKVKPFSPITINQKLFKQNSKGNMIKHVIVQLSSIIDGYG